MPDVSWHGPGIAANDEKTSAMIARFIFSQIYGTQKVLSLDFKKDSSDFSFF